MPKLTQCERILQYIKDFGSITTRDAFIEFGCTRLSGRIYDLKKQGYQFNGKTVQSENRYGETVRYKEYKLVG